MGECVGYLSAQHSQQGTCALRGQKAAVKKLPLISPCSPVLTERQKIN